MDTTGWTEVKGKGKAKKPAASKEAAPKTNTPPQNAPKGPATAMKAPQKQLVNGLLPLGKWLAEPNRKYRFRKTHKPVEWVEKYRPGGYHPLEIGGSLGPEKFTNQFTVLRKLGHGDRSTTWLVHDEDQNDRVALRILAAEYSGDLAREARMRRKLERLNRGSYDRLLVTLHEQFTQHGPNGKHAVGVYEPMGPSVAQLLEKPEYKSTGIAAVRARFPPNIAKAVLRQTLEALELMHYGGVIHGDVQPSNVFFALNRNGMSVQRAEELQLVQPAKGTISRKPTSEAVIAYGKADEHAPKKVYVADPLVYYTEPEAKVEVKLGDLSSAFFEDSPPRGRTNLPANLRTPEAVLTGKAANPYDIDVWAWGCLLFELLAGHALFFTGPNPAPAQRDDHHLLGVIAALGPLPDDLYKAWKRSHRYFDEKRELFNSNTDGKEQFKFEQASIETLFDRAQVAVSEKEADAIKALLRKVLQVDPAKRLSSEEILQDHWFTRFV